MKQITALQMKTLIRNGQLAQNNPDYDPKPVVKLFTPDAGATWLLAWIDAEDADIAFGLCDLGHGCTELGSVRLSELARVRGGLGLPIERDRHWSACHSLGAYAKASQTKGRIVEEP